MPNTKTDMQFNEQEKKDESDKKVLIGMSIDMCIKDVNEQKKKRSH